MKKRITLADFFKICSELQTHREVFVKECHTKVEAVSWLETRLGFQVPINSLEKALNATGVQMEKLKRQPKKDSYIVHHRMRVLCNAVIELYKRLGEEPPSDVIQLRNHSDGRATILQKSESTQEPKPHKPVVAIPVKTVPESNTIPIINGRK